jgi:Ca2+-binding RTX toxin-like protein
VIEAAAGNDRLLARGGDDLVRGGDGDDTAWGSYGDDVLYGDAGAVLGTAYTTRGGSGAGWSLGRRVQAPDTSAPRKSGRIAHDVSPRLANARG